MVARLLDVPLAVLLRAAREMGFRVERHPCANDDYLIGIGKADVMRAERRRIARRLAEER
jgi:hypothetical protein